MKSLERLMLVVAYISSSVHSFAYVEGDETRQYMASTAEVTVLYEFTGSFQPSSAHTMSLYGGPPGAKNKCEMASTFADGTVQAFLNEKNYFTIGPEKSIPAITSGYSYIAAFGVLFDSKADILKYEYVASPRRLFLWRVCGRASWDHACVSPVAARLLQPRRPAVFQ